MPTANAPLAVLDQIDFKAVARDVVKRETRGEVRAFERGPLHELAQFARLRNENEAVLRLRHVEHVFQGGEITLDDVEGELRRGNRVLLFVRHAERPKIDGDDPTFGGREIDEVLADYVEEYLRSVLPDELQEMVPAMVRMGNNVKLWKENNVSVNINSRKPVTTCGFVRAYPGVAGTKFPPLTRESFEKLIDDLLDDYKYLVSGCIQNACSADPDFNGQGLDLAILAGGHSSWYFAKDILDGKK